MRSRALMLRIGVVLVIALSMTASACSSPSSSATPAASPSPSASVAPSKAEVTAAVKRLIKQRHFPSPGRISISKVEKDRNGRWQASAYLMPPLMMSYFPSIMVIVRNPDGWRVVSLKADRTFGGTPSPRATIQLP